MCGRFVGAFSTEDLVKELGGSVMRRGLSIDSLVGNTGIDLAANYNVAPTTRSRILLAHADHLDLLAVPWGLRQRWAPAGGQPRPMINARSETVSDKPSFRHLIGPHRCVIPMNGFYEWKRSESDKQPFFCARTDGLLMWAAGIWQPPTSESSGGFCVLTRPSKGDLVDIHDRCPVHFDVDDALEWITSATAPMELCWSDEQPVLHCRAVSRKVNSVRNNGPELLSTVGKEGETPPTLF